VETDDLIAQLVEALDHDLELIERLRYRLVVLGALAAADQGPSVPEAIRELGIAADELRMADLVRVAAMARVANELDLHPTSRVDALATRAGGAWSGVLLDRRRSLTEAVTGVQGLAGTVSAAMGRRASLADEALAFLRADGNATYGRSVPRGGVLVEGAI
jgi:hypothetical protein